MIINSQFSIHFHFHSPIHFHSVSDSNSVLAEGEDYEPILPKPCMSYSYTSVVVKGSRKWSTFLKGNKYSKCRTNSHAGKHTKVF